MPLPHRPLTILAALAALCLAPAARAGLAGEGADESPPISWSAFGTVGLAVSDQPWRYQRFISDRPSVERDTVFGVQADLELAPRWTATVQARLAPSEKHDSRWDLTTAWAFAAWRPDNAWLLRAGKLRVPFLLRSEQLDVGQTYDEARLPAEIYALPPTNDFTGAHASHTWSLPRGDLSLDGYFGDSNLTERFWLGDPVPSPLPGQPALRPAGALFTTVNVAVQGLVLTWRAPDLLARAGVHHARTRRVDGGQLTVRPTWAPLGPGIGYWQTDNALPGPGLAEVPRIHNLLFTLGADAQLARGWRVAGELLRVRQFDSEVGADVWATYGTVYRSLGAFTPYATVAASHTTSQGAYWSRTLDTTTVPAAVPGAALLNASMRARADTIPVTRQVSLALGSSYALSPTRKLKLEWLHTRSRVSTMIDVPSGEPLEQRRRVNVLSASYSFVF